MSKNSYFDTKIEFLKGIGPQRARLLNTEINVFTYADLLQHYPFRYEDRTKIYDIAQISHDLPYIQVKGKITYMETVGEGAKKRFTAYLRDDTGEVELVWFRGVQWIEKKLKKNVEYKVYGKPTSFQSAWNIVHPEIEIFDDSAEHKGYLQPIYHSTEKLKNAGFDSKGLANSMKILLEQAIPNIQETIPIYIIQKLKLISKQQAIQYIHIPPDAASLEMARYRLKFEELFYNQLKLLKTKQINKSKNDGAVFANMQHVHTFYNNILPFQLTNAQKNAIREIHNDVKVGKQMNRLLQGDVGSGKTIVAFIAILMATSNNFQTCIMAPTEILAQQHYNNLSEWTQMLGIKIALLTGSTKKSERALIHQYLLSGELLILIGTHALLEDDVQFHNLALCVIDEQHRFGVAQRARLWKKNEQFTPHILVMTATPIPRTLAMTFYGDLDASVINEMPAGRIPIKTLHKIEGQRLALFGFMKQQISLGRQIYVVYPLIEESEKSDLLNLYSGYEYLSQEFPLPEYKIAIIHGKLPQEDKEFAMKLFVENKAQIMVATTVIEVGINVANATVMVIENAERFGLAQLHQLRGRVGRGSEQSYCVLMTSDKISQESREKIQTMVRTNNGFEIAETDLKLRGPGDMMGTRQSGVHDLIVANLATDGEILSTARQYAQAVIESDPDFLLKDNLFIKQHIDSLHQNTTNWGKIS
ncbi:MAG: ATP-dependent DNA helicase RecG [Cytophagales bacterium]|nr:ATP-dependent DNA helicase RecG [Cytophagales bacterium]